MKPIKNIAAIAAMVLSCLLMLSACKKSNESADPAPAKYKNKIAYLYKKDSADATAYKTLLQANNCGVELVDMSQANNTDFKKFDLIVIGHNSSDDAYDFAAITGPIKAANKPVLMIGEGGGHFGEMINTTVNWSECFGISFPLAMTVIDSSMSIYKSPKKIAIPANRQLTIFDQSPYGQAFEESIFSQYPNVETIGQATPSKSNDFSVTLESGKYGFFGYYNNVNAMSQTGKDFMVNLTYYVGKLN